MFILKRLFLFITLFSLAFFIIRYFNFPPHELLTSNLSGVSWLFSTIGLIFSIISAFIIQTQWNRWDRLETSVKGEINSMWELILFCDQLPVKIAGDIKEGLKDYILAVIEGWSQMDKGIPSPAEEKSLRKLQKRLFILLKKEPEDSEMASSMFLGILDNRNERLHYSTGHLPFLLYVLISVATFLVIFLSLFIAVPNLWLDYLFTMSIGLLAFLVFSVIEDLNHPFRPGTWHITERSFKELLKKL